MALLEADLSGLDQLELPFPKKPNPAGRIWNATWPKALAVAIFFGVWQILVWTEWKPEFLLPSPATVLDELFSNPDQYLDGARLTLERGFQGFLLAVLIGSVIGVAVARVPVLRAAIGSMITGLQTMPSVAWVPLALLLFKNNADSVVFFVVVLGAAPSIANGLISGIDHIPPVLLRAGRVLGARRLSSLRYVLLPAALPAFVSGLKQGWAFAWRSLLAAELIAHVAGHVSLGELLYNNQQVLDAPGVLATMMVIFTIGVVVDALLFGTIERRVRRRYGLIDDAA